MKNRDADIDTVGEPGVEGPREDYDPAVVESKWQKRWAEDGLYESSIDSSQRKHYALTMLPYPSGELHIGHWYAMTPSDARARFMRMRGHNVLFPIGFDAFGLPAENAAIRNQTHPREWTYANIERMRGQLRSMGAMYDWRREATSADPEYYRWTQWFFLKLLEHDLAYRKLSAVDWCPSCNTTLAREQVQGEDRHCERCRTPVDKRKLEQWFFRITSYADELLDFSQLDWPKRIEAAQTNWIDRSEGAYVEFAIEGSEAGSEERALEVFTTRPDTLWGATFMVVAPEHPWLPELMTAEHRAEVEEYVNQAARTTDIEREAADRPKTGVPTGSSAINPVNGESIPIWVADYVLAEYGTGAIMAVPAHDERDFDFARKYGIEIRPVIEPADGTSGAALEEAYLGEGRMINSGPLSGTPGEEAVKKTLRYLADHGRGRPGVNYRLRDWLISRQRFWGAPIPVVYCDDCGAVPVPESDLPVLLPEEVEWRPTGESPLLLHSTWRSTTCPGCGGAAKRETDTMDTFMCSSWYHLRYLSPHYDEGPFDPDEYAYWMPVDTYTGGAEHGTMHLIYTRFFHKACRDMGITSGDEPMLQLRNQGVILGEDSEKMSKSRGNVVAPDDLVERYGADTLRAFLMFFARWSKGGPWNSRGIAGTKRWLHRVWRAFSDDSSLEASGDSTATAELHREVHQALAAVTRDFEEFEFNTTVSTLMELLRKLESLRNQGGLASEDWRAARSIYLRMLAPIAPHLAEELWQLHEGGDSIHLQPWPEVDEAATRQETVTLVVQIDGKLRDRLELPADIEQAQAEEAALGSSSVGRFLADREPVRFVYVPGKILNIITKPRG